MDAWSASGLGTGVQFLQSFVQHVLPHQFQKVRHYGWMSSNSRFDIAKGRWLVWLWLGWTYWLGSGMVVPDKRKPEALRCEHCGGDLQLLAIIRRMAECWYEYGALVFQLDEHELGRRGAAGLRDVD